MAAGHPSLQAGTSLLSNNFGIKELKLQAIIQMAYLSNHNQQVRDQQKRELLKLKLNLGGCGGCGG